jgi:hypothetical protein
VRVAGIDFLSHPHQRAGSMFLIEPGGFTGFSGGVDMRLNQQAMPQGPGSFDIPSFADSRTLKISGTALAASFAHRRILEERFSGILAGGQTEIVQVERDGETRWAMAKLATAPIFEGHGVVPKARFQLQLWCPDPRKFGVTREEELISGQSRTLVHYGNYDASPLVVINGPVVGGYTLSSNEGRVYRVNAGIAAGSMHSVDMNDGLLRVNGQVQAGLVGRADIWDIPPGLLPSGGTLNMALFPDSGTATGTVYITDTYI